MNRINKENNFIYLTMALLVMLLALPVLADIEHGAVMWITRGLMVCTLLLTYLSLDFGRWWGRFVLLILFLLVTSTLLQQLDSRFTASSLHLVMMMLFFGSVAYSAGHRVLFREKTDQNRIVGSVAVYLLLGLLWAMIYLLLLEFQPDALGGIEHRQWEENFFEVTYFSFVTLTTLGYGDITPTHSASSALAYLESITGTFYMAVVVSSLVAARSRTRIASH